MKKLKHIVEVCKRLNRHELPVAIIQNGTSTDEQYCYGTISDIESKAKSRNLSNPAAIVIGEVVRKGRHFPKERVLTAMDDLSMESLTP